MKSTLKNLKQALPSINKKKSLSSTSSKAGSLEDDLVTASSIATRSSTGRSSSKRIPRRTEGGGDEVVSPTPERMIISTTSRHSRKSSGNTACTEGSNSTGLDFLATTEFAMEDEDLDATPVSRLVEMRSHRRWEVHDTILDAVGQTPIVRLQRAPIPKGVKLYVKCENANPAGSLKDRLALGIIEWAEKHGMIQPGQTVVEASSGNTGVAMAMVCASRGYPFVCVMSEAFSIERRKLMRFLGAKVILTPKANKATGMVIKAQELADKHGFFYAQQFENEANAWIHEQTTGPEIIGAFSKLRKKLDHFFMAYGTGGTVLGVSRAFRKANMGTKIHLCEPSSAAMVSSGIPTRYPKQGSGALTTAFDTAHPSWSPHLMQGWATDFIPKLLSTAKEEGAFQQVHQVSGSDAIATSHHLAKTEGIFVGISGGGILSAAIRFAQTCPPGTSILATLTDTGERYLSTALFEQVPVEMTEEERLLSESTPSAPPPPPPALNGILPADTDQLFDI